MARGMNIPKLSRKKQATIATDLLSGVFTLLCTVLLAGAPVYAQSNGGFLTGSAGSTTIQGSTESTTLEGGTASTTLQGGTDSTTLQGGTEGTLIQGRAQREGGPITILFLVDASLSMKDGLGHDVQKMDAAKKVLQNALTRIPTDVRLGLRVFGQFATPGLECRASALLVPPGVGNRRTIVEKMRRIQPTGMTPLTYAIYQAAESDLARVDGTKTIILITDGAETCGEDPCAYISTLPSKGIKLKIDILGLDLKREPDAKRQLDCIASKSGGKYYDNDTSAKLIENLSHSVSQAISGTVITPGVKTKDILNPETPPELVPILPAGKLEDFNKLQQDADQQQNKPEPSKKSEQSKKSEASEKSSTKSQPFKKSKPSQSPNK